MRERRKGPIGRAAGLAEGVAATMRRMQREREPRVLVYDETGYARLVQPEGRGHERLLEIAERMVALVDESDAAATAAPPAPRRPRRGRRVSLVDPALAERVLERALARGGDFAELYAEARNGFAISLDDGRVERPQGGRELGACVRVVSGDSTYYGHVDGLAEEDLLRVAESACRRCAATRASPRG